MFLAPVDRHDIDLSVFRPEAADPLGHQRQPAGIALLADPLAAELFEGVGADEGDHLPANLLPRRLDTP
ncbi:MAG: hypothetical protein AAF560_19750 [Acidobacteriota bacterium]